MVPNSAPGRLNRRPLGDACESANGSLSGARSAFTVESVESSAAAGLPPGAFAGGSDGVAHGSGVARGAWLCRLGAVRGSGTVVGMRSGAGGGGRARLRLLPRGPLSGHIINTAAATIASIAATITSTGQLRHADVAGSAVWLGAVGRG